MKFLTILGLGLVALTPTVFAGPIAYGICQAGCAGVVMACYGATARLGVQRRVPQLLAVSWPATPPLALARQSALSLHLRPRSSQQVCFWSRFPGFPKFVS